MDWLLKLDQDLLGFINFDLANSAFDWFFVGLTDFHKTLTFQAFVLPVMILLAWKQNKIIGPIIVFGLALSLAINDLIGSKIIKAFFHRPRPDVAGLSVILRAPHYGGYSFVSNHASNMFCLAVFLGFFYPKIRWLLATLAFLVAFSRVYVGVHYPSDIVAGALLGSLIGWAGSRVLGKFLDKKYSKEVRNG